MGFCDREERETEQAELLWERDHARTERDLLKTENERLRQLLGLATTAVQAEYSLRISEPLICANCGNPGREHHLPLLTCKPADTGAEHGP